MPQPILEQFERRHALLSRRHHERRGSRRVAHVRRPIGIGLGLQCDRAADRLDRVIGPEVGHAGHREPRLRRLHRPSELLTDDRDVGEERPRLARHAPQAAEGGERLREPPLPGMVERGVEFEPPWRIPLDGLERRLAAERRGHAGRAEDRAEKPQLVRRHETLLGKPFDDPLREADVAALRGRLA